MQRDQQSRIRQTRRRRQHLQSHLYSFWQVRDNSSELVANHRIEELIAAASPYFDWILIDAPPVLAVTDAVELARAADAVLLVARGARRPLKLLSAPRPPSATRASSALCSMTVKDAPRSRSYNYNYYYHETGGRRGHAKTAKG